MWQWFVRGQCYLNRPIGLFAIAPSIRQEALRNQPITSISHDSIQWIYNGRIRTRNEIRWAQGERERERKTGTKRGLWKDGEHGSVKQRARGGFSFGLCQWPLCGGVCCLYVVWNKQVIVEGWGDELWLCLTVNCTVCVRLQPFMLYSKCARICLHTVFLFNHTYMVEHMHVQMCTLVYLLACVQREAVTLSLFRG